MDLCILIPAIVGIISAILGFLLGKTLSSKTNGKTSSSNNKPSVDSSKPVKTEEGAVKTVFSALLAKSVYGKKIELNDLTIIKGIDSEIANLLIEKGISTWEQLSECSVEECQDILKSAGGQHNAHNIETWPKQAKLASKDKWQQLNVWQNGLDGEN